MIRVTQDRVHREIRQRLVSMLGLPESRVYLTTEPKFTEAMDFVVQVSPISAGATNEFNRSGLGFITERFAVTTFVRNASDNDIKQSRQIAGEERGVLARQADVRAALIQHSLGGILQVDIRLVSSGPIRTEPRSGNYLMATDVFICSYATPWPVSGLLRSGFRATAPTWAQLGNEVNADGKIAYTQTYTRLSSTPEYFWFAVPDEMHQRGTRIFTAEGEEQFYRTGFPAPSGPAAGTITQDSVLYHLYRRAYPTTALALTYRIEVA